ncbi:ABC transporter permease [Paracoccus sp. (in: a-proteobacteria)]|uniref:ABC transporter permease n=1 Tax=Paracoccus sp. TaxID=267 RepID=UPI002AFF6BB6|nr:SMP-30/gluconolactonase/LRE family protein [Paracoccus sp. (in: a-proteobacteria)]
MTTAEALTRLRYKLFPDHLVGEVLAKRWIDNAIPFTTMVLAVAILAFINPTLLTANGLIDLGQQGAEFGLIVIALAIVMLSGGIDLSVGAIYALAILGTLTCLNVLGLSFPATLLVVLAIGGTCGMINGFLIGYLRLRAFLTTLVMLVIYRSIFELWWPLVSSQIVMGSSDSKIWDFLSYETLLGLPPSMWVFAFIALALHVMLSRMRPGWHIQAVGGQRRSSYNAGINVRRTLFLTYILSGLLCAVAGLLFAARIGSAGSDTGVGMEIAALTAVVLGGNSLGGGRGSVPKALMGVVIFLVLSNSMIQLAVPGPTAALILSSVLILAVFVDVRWLKHRDKLLSKIYVAPTFFKLPKAPETDEGSSSVWAVNNRLHNVELIGLGEIEGPEDPLIDWDDNVYAGNRQGEIIKFHAPDHKTWEVYAHIGGHPLGMQFDRHGNLVCCVSGMGLYMVTPDREVVKLTDETNRSRFSIVDDTRMRLADDLDIAADGRIFFSEATVRYNHVDWPLDSLELRGNGRLICYDPRTKTTRTVLKRLMFPNGVCVMPDQESLLFAETWGCRISRFWFDGPKKGQVERVIENLPGLPDNINRASDGNYWTTLVGMRSPAMDLASTMPGFRRRMTRRMGPANWMMPNINVGCAVKFNDSVAQIG